MAIQCPKCDGPTEHDRELPPNPYVCEYCVLEAERDRLKAQLLDRETRLDESRSIRKELETQLAAVREELELANGSLRGYGAPTTARLRLAQQELTAERQRADELQAELESANLAVAELVSELPGGTVTAGIHKSMKLGRKTRARLQRNIDRRDAIIEGMRESHTNLKLEWCEVQEGLEKAEARVGELEDKMRRCASSLEYGEQLLRRTMSGNFSHSVNNVIGMMGGWARVFCSALTPNESQEEDDELRGCVDGCGVFHHEPGCVARQSEGCDVE